jgi:hypothetical protein
MTEESGMGQIPMPKHVTDRVEKRRAGARFGKEGRLDAALIDDKLARWRAQRTDIFLYRRLMKTKLSDVERQSIEQRFALYRKRLNNIWGATWHTKLGGRSPPS